MTVFFDFGEAKIRPEYNELLDAFAGDLKGLLDVSRGDTKGSGLKISIEGHTDNVGSYEYNKDLSERRAKAVKEYLAKVHKIPRERLKTEGYAYTKPLSSNLTEEGRAQNRRVQFKRD